ncbi:MAG: hypothetical protein GF346_07540 [Candidatus Eisenbacteria bacterium]|nr:hypothetical protein [Candidatus Latescibacterota bacterium]MBD3302285.1 hypothetical protein [Candidatus Eisenbacteria bacterium]
MANGENNGLPESDNPVLGALFEILRTTNSPAIQRARELIAHRIAVSGEVAPSRVPPPLNITEVGGYYNLLGSLDEPILQARLVTAALGIAGPDATLPPPGAGPFLFFATREGTRPAGPMQATFPLSFTIRSDFAEAFDRCLETLSGLGGAVPVLSPPRGLPTPDVAPPEDGAAQLALVGRILTLAPTAALNDPTTDPLSVSRLVSGGGFQVVARQIDPAAPDAGSVGDEDWSSWRCDANTCSEVATTDARVPLEPLLNQAGWHRLAPLTNPNSLTTPGNWAEWGNVTGLVPGRTTFGDELRAVFPLSAILNSSVLAMQDKVWDGQAFA